MKNQRKELEKLKVEQLDFIMENMVDGFLEEHKLEKELQLDYKNKIELVMNDKYLIGLFVCYLFAQIRAMVFEDIAQKAKDEFNKHLN